MKLRRGDLIPVIVAAIVAVSHFAGRVDRSDTHLHVPPTCDGFRCAQAILRPDLHSRPAFCPRVRTPTSSTYRQLNQGRRR